MPALRSRLPLRGGLRSRCAALAPRGGGGGGGEFPPTAGRLHPELNGTASSSDAAREGAHRSVACCTIVNSALPCNHQHLHRLAAETLCTQFFS